MPGKFIVFEGLDGSGKGSMLGRTAAYLFKERKDLDRIVLTREPTFSHFGKQIRKILRTDLDPMAQAKELLRLYLEDRKEHLEKVIRPALNNNAVVLCDRYKYSTMAYQTAQGIPLESIIAAHKRMLVPDLVLVLDVPAQVAVSRIREEKGRVLEKFEKREFLQKLRETYLVLPRILSKEPIRIIEASRPKKEVFADIQKALKSLFPLPAKD